MKIGWLIGGVLIGLFAVAQLLQLLGFIGIGFTIAGVGITAGATAVSLLCFQKSLPTKPMQ